MNKKMILGIALALVLVSGSFFSAHAQCGCMNFCNWNPCNLFSCGSSCARDRDLGPYNPFPQSVHSIGVTGCCQGPAPAIQ
jgi:hypothetical protein